MDVDDELAEDLSHRPTSLEELDKFSLEDLQDDLNSVERSRSFESWEVYERTEDSDKENEPPEPQNGSKYKTSKENTDGGNSGKKRKPGKTLSIENQPPQNSKPRPQAKEDLSSPHKLRKIDRPDKFYADPEESDKKFLPGKPLAAAAGTRKRKESESAGKSPTKRQGPKRTELVQPTSKDVLNGRGPNITNRPANQKFLRDARKLGKKYKKSPKKGKTALCKQVIDEFEQSGGRFLFLVNKKSEEHREMTDNEKHEKARHALCGAKKN